MFASFGKKWTLPFFPSTNTGLSILNENKLCGQDENSYFVLMQSRRGRNSMFSAIKAFQLPLQIHARPIYEMVEFHHSPYLTYFVKAINLRYSAVAGSALPIAFSNVFSVNIY